MKYNGEILEAVKRISLTDIARALGFSPVHLGRYVTLKEIDSMRIYNDSTWNRFSGISTNGHTGGTQIDFVMEYGNLDFKEAVEWLMNFSNISLSDIQPFNENKIHMKEDVVKKEIALPEKESTFKHVYGYLINTRGLSKDTVDFCVKNGLLYEAKDTRNAVFLGVDKDGNVRFASQRGTYDLKNKYKKDVYGSDKSYGFNIRADSETVHVFEAAIDLLSFADVYGFEENMVALGMLSDGPLKTFLDEERGIRKIVLHLDNDEPGRNASHKLCDKYDGLGYQVSDEPPPKDYKDMNEWLVNCKRTLNTDRNKDNQSIGVKK